MSIILRSIQNKGFSPFPYQQICIHKMPFSFCLGYFYIWYAHAFIFVDIQTLFLTKQKWRAKAQAFAGETYNPLRYLVDYDLQVAEEKAKYDEVRKQTKEEMFEVKDVM